MSLLVSSSSEFLEKERLRAKARHDEAQALSNARHEEKFEIARKLLKRNRPVEEIIEDTGLAREEIESIWHPCSVYLKIVRKLR